MTCYDPNHPQQPQPTVNITAKSTKSEIIDASLEVIMTQDEQISELKQRQTILFILCAILGSLLILS